MCDLVSYMTQCRFTSLTFFLFLTLNVRKMREAEKVEIFSLYSSMQQKEEVVTATCNGFQITAFLSSYISLAFVHLLHCISELIHFR